MAANLKDGIAGEMERWRRQWGALVERALAYLGPRATVIVARARRDLGLRAIALLLAIGLWVFVNAGQRGALTEMRVPISYRSLPVGLAIVNQRPDFVQVEVRGPRTLLSLLDPDRLTLRLDLSGVAVGEAVFKIGPEMFNVPRQTDVSRISPSQIVLDIDRITERLIPIHLDIQGQAAVGYHISAVKLTPPYATVKGPSRFLGHIDVVQTTPFDLNGASGDVEQPLELLSPSDRVTIEAPRNVEAMVTVSLVISSREFFGVPIEVRDTDLKVRVDPQRVNVTVRGPLGRLSGLKLRGAVYVTADGVPPGTHDLPVKVELPDGVQLVRANPDNVKVRLYQDKRAGRG
jgi:YbbR domain-containing protein